VLHESEVETKSIQPLLSKFIGTPFIKDVVDPLNDIGLSPNNNSFDVKTPLPSFRAI
jgi:hypothetical protein